MWNRTWYRKCVLCGAFTLLFGLASAGQVQAQAGVFLKRTATFSQTASAVATFIINGPKADNDTTTIWLEFGSDDMGVALPGPFNGVTFQLQKTGTAAPLSLTNGLDNPAYGGKRIQFADENSSAGAPRVLRLDITHYDATGVAIQAGSFETWMLTISLPSAISPLVRFIAYPIDAAVQFTALTPTGPCTAASFPVNVAVTTPAAGSVRFEATVPSGAPTGLTYQWTAEGDASAARGMASGNILTYNLEDCSGCCCRNITYKVDVKQGTTVLSSNRGVYVQKDLNCGGGPVFCPPVDYFKGKVVVVIPWPWPPGPCSSCPPEWKTLVPLEEIRKIVGLRPIDEKGSSLGSGLRSAIKLGLKGARLIGPVMETPNGEYFAAIQYKKGANPRVSASISLKGKTLSIGEISAEP